MSAGAGVEGRVVAPSWLKVWWLAIRPKTLSASVVPVALGTALAGASQHFDPVMALAALFGAILLQVSSNLANDLFDFIKGADTDARLGPARAAQKGWLTVRQLAWGTALSVLLAVAAGVVLIAHAGWPVVVVGVKRAQKDSQITACQLVQGKIRVAISTYQLKNRTIDPNDITMEALAPYFDGKAPECPAGGEYTFELGEDADGDETVVVKCSVEGHNKEEEEEE